MPHVLFLKMDHELQIMRIQDVSHIPWTQQATETVFMIKLEAITLKKYVFVEVSTKWNMHPMHAIYSTPKLYMNGMCKLILLSKLLLCVITAWLLCSGAIVSNFGYVM